ncbi:MAG: hypothetical protein EPN57_22820 [Paraburkholderia sp.]|nr:MAG: hypothetical protein EPN57_22820 [Paraburkholderia sp.]
MDRQAGAGLNPRRLFFARVSGLDRWQHKPLAPISRYEKLFCVVKICAAWHNNCRCGMENVVSY